MKKTEKKTTSETLNQVQNYLKQNKDYHYRFYQGKVVIEEDVFLGFNCVIAKPVTIGKGSVIGANTVITKDIPPNSIVVNPECINIKKK